MERRKWLGDISVRVVGGGAVVACELLGVGGVEVGTGIALDGNFVEGRLGEEVWIRRVNFLCML